MAMRAGHLIITFLLLLTGSVLSGQADIRISEEFSDIRASEVLQQLSEKYQINFAYDSFQIGKIRGSWVFENVSPAQVLTTLLAETDFVFKLLDETYVIFLEAAIDQSPESEEVGEEFTRIQGEIRDAYSRELLPFAVLTIANTFFVLNANSEGQFTIENALDENDTLEVFFVGFEVKVIPVKEILHKSFVSIYLTESRNYLPDVMITAEGVSLQKTGYIPGLHVMNPSSLSVIQGTGEADVMRAAQILPGINATQESSNGLYIRGSNNDQTQISFDGFNLYHQDHFFGAFTSVNANAVKAMNIHKGITDARFGGRTAGVVEIFGKEGNLNKSAGQIDLGPFAIGAVFEAPMDTAGKSSIFIAARRAFTNVIFSPTYKSLFNTTYNAAVVTSPKKGAQTFGTNDPEFFFQDVNVKFTYRPTKRDFLNLSIYTSHDQLFVQYADSSDKELENPQNISYTDENYKKNAGASLRWGRAWKNDWSSTFVAGFSRFTGSFFSSDSINDLLFQTDSVRFTSELTSLDDFDGRFEMSKKFNRHQFISGLQVNSISSSLKKNEVGEILKDTTATGTIVSAYVSVENESNDRLKIRPGLRVNYFSRTSLFYLEPRLLAQFELIKKTFDLKASVGRVHQYIQRTQTQSLYLNTPDYWWLAESSGKGVLQSDQIMFGFIVHKKNWTFDAEGYYKRTNGNILNRSLYGNTSLTVEVPFLIGQGRAYGADFLLSKDYKRHHIVVSYSLMKTESDFPEAQLKNIPEVFDQRHELKLNYQLNLKRWDFSLFWVYGSGRPFTPLLGTYNFQLPDGEFRKLPVYGNPNSARLPEYHRLDVTAAYHFMLGSTRVNIQASVFNVYNRVNVRDIQYLTARTSSNPNDFSVAKRSLQMLGFLPSLNLKLNF